MAVDASSVEEPAVKDPKTKKLAKGKLTTENFTSSMAITPNKPTINKSGPTKRNAMNGKADGKLSKTTSQGSKPNLAASSSKPKTKALDNPGSNKRSATDAELSEIVTKKLRVKSGVKVPS